MRGYDSFVSLPGKKLLFASLLLTLAGCDCGSTPPTGCRSAADCAAGQVCTDMQCVTPPDGGMMVMPDASAADASACPGSRMCGTACCAPGESCGAGNVCCAAADLCGGTCCGGDGVQCVADMCVLDCGTNAPCGTGSAATCCAVDDVCLLDACTTPGAACAGPFACPADAYCEASIGRCLPRATGFPACEYRPPVSETFELDVEWHWSGDAEVLPLHNQVMSTPLVANLTDDNGDGRIDENDVPDVVFNTFAGSAYTVDGVLRAISGSDGSRIWPTTDPGYRTQPGLEVAIADIRSDSPGPEIIGCTFETGGSGSSHLTIFSATGAVLHRFATGVVAPCGRPGVADMNGDGVAEIVVGTAIVQADASSMVLAPAARSGIGTIYDMDGDGDLEAIGINGVAHHDGTTLWEVPVPAGSGYVAVADVDLDGDPDVVSTNTTTHQIQVRDGATGMLLAGPVEITPVEDPIIAARVESIRMSRPDRDPLTGGGPPTIANFDSDPEPEIAMAGGYAYVIFERDLSRKWYEVTQDTSSRVTGSSVFDFEGDGIAEVLYNDERFFRAFRGPTGDVYLERCNLSGTLTEYPIVVDVDNDDHAEIILAANNYAFGGLCVDGSTASTGVWSFGHPRAQWVRTRRIWNEHAYHVTNINEDGTLPAREAPNFSTVGLNNFRQNVQPEGLFNAPDLVLRDLANVCRADMILRARVTNEGRAGAPAGIPVSFYIDGSFVGRATTRRALLPGASEVVEVPFASFVGDTTYMLTARVNDPEHDPLEGLNECRATNNETGPVPAFCAGIQ